jgi:hypothetical protein
MKKKYDVCTIIGPMPSHTGLALKVKYKYMQMFLWNEFVTFDSKAIFFCNSINRVFFGE